MRWSNWSGRITAEPDRIARPRDEAELVEAVAEASARRQPMRVVGAAHSHSALVPTDGLLIDPSALTGVVDVDARAGVARIRGGTRIVDLGRPLLERGVALRNQGDIDRQAIAGAVATGTHGTGQELQNLSASVVAARIVGPGGEVVCCDAGSRPDLFECARLSLGALGVVSELTLRVRDAYKLQERMWLEDLDEVLDRIDERSAATRHFEFFWVPGRRRAACKALAETDAEPVHPLGAEGQRLAYSFEVLANDRPDKHSEMEYSIAREHGPECLRALREMIARDFPDLAWPIEYRNLAADEVWLSTAYRRPSVTLSVHQGIDRPDEPLFRACEAIFRQYEGRPHWGKVHYLGAQDLAAMHPRHADWWRVRDAWDPDGLFVNAHLASLRPGA
jgi:FAD/FMN-containing dehydrogenase